MRRTFTHFLYAIASVLLTSFYSLYAQPANDAICSAVSLTVNASNCTSGTNVAATTVTQDPVGSCWVGGTKSHTVWYSFIAPSSGNVTVTTDHSGGGTLTDSQIAVFSSSDNTCTGTLTAVGCDEDGGTTCNYCASVSLTGLTPGRIYFIEVDGYANNTGTFCIDIHDGGAVLTNDNCANAMNLWVGSTCSFLTQCTYTNYPNTTTATSEAWETAPACWTQGTTLNTVWYKFTAVGTSTNLQIPSVLAGNDPHVAVYSGTCGSFTLVACQEDKGGAIPGNLGVDITFATTVGQTYYIQYDSNNSTSCNDICLSSTGGLSVPANNACASASTLSLNSVVTGNTYRGTADGTFSCGSTENSLWYRFTPSVTGTYYFTLMNQTGCMSSNNTSATHTSFYTSNVQMVVYNTGTCTPGSGNEISCTSNLNTSNIDLNMVLTGGNNYLILVDGHGGAACQFDLIATTSSVLPVSMAYFNGRAEEKENLLEWGTVTEINNDYFLVQRSSNGTDFITIGRVVGNGNSDKLISYVFRDKEPLPGVSYYRLKQIDFDGQESYPTSIIALQGGIPEREVFRTYPNPNYGSALFIDINTPAEKLSIKDMYGAEVFVKLLERKAGITEQVDFEKNLSPGVYIVSVMAGGETHLQKLIIK